MKDMRQPMERLFCCILTAVLSFGAGISFSAAVASQAEEEMNVSGGWNFTVETSAGTGNPTFTFKQEGEKLTGTYKGLFGAADLTGTVKGREIKFSFKVDFQGQAAEITYEGKIEDKTSMKGTVKMADFGEGTWTAKKQP